MMPNVKRMNFILRCVVLAAHGIAFSIFLPTVGHAQSVDNVRYAMVLLKMKALNMGAPAIKGEEAVAGKPAPALYFGANKMNNNFAVVDDVKNTVGGTATLFVKSGEEFIRVATNVQKDDGSRAIGTVLDPNGKAIAAIRGGGAYYGDANILGKSYITGYEPIQDSLGRVIGVYYVGYPKAQ